MRRAGQLAARRAPVAVRGRPRVAKRQPGCGTFATGTDQGKRKRAPSASGGGRMFLRTGERNVWLIKAPENTPAPGLKQRGDVGVSGQLRTEVKMGEDSTMKSVPKPLEVPIAVLIFLAAAWCGSRVGWADSPVDGGPTRKALSTEEAGGPRNFPWISSSHSSTAALPPPIAQRQRASADSLASATESGGSSGSRLSARAAGGLGPQSSGEAVRDAAADKSVRLREGTELKDRLAVFKPAGDRTLCFVSGMPQRMIVLENLALERVLQTLERSSVELQWSVRGVVSEYRGANYLLIQRAVVLGPTGVSRAE